MTGLNVIVLSPTGKMYGLFNKEPIEYKSEDLLYVSSDENKDFLSKSHEMNQETLQSSRFGVEINNLQSSRFGVEINNLQSSRFGVEINNRAVL